MATDALVNQNVGQDYFDIFRLPDPNEPLDALDQTILKHETLVRKLKSHRNTLIPISRILPEILCRIFDFEREGAVPSSLVAVTHVCQSWRNAAIDCSTLWTDIAITSIPWTDEMLRRSKMSSLTIRASMNEFLTPAKTLPSLFRNLQVALTHMARIKELSINGSPGCCVRVQPLLEHLPVSAPVLESLTISVLRFKFLSERELGHCKLPPKALSNVDRLCRLQLSRCNVDWESPVFRHLTYLSVENVSDDSRPSTTQLSTILQRLPSLLHLALKNCLPIGGRYIEEGSIHLPHLGSLVLSGKVVELEPWLRTMTISPTSSIELQCDEPEANAILLNLLQAPRRSSGMTLTLPVYTLKIFDGTSHQRSPMVSLTFGTGPVLHVTRGSNRTLSGQTNPFLTQICNNLPVGKLTYLHFTSSASIDPQLIANTLGRLPCLESVVVSGEVIKYFIRSLTMTSATQSRSSPPLVFPQLRQVSLYGVRFTTSAEGDGIYFENLRDCLIERYELGFEIEEVFVHRSPDVSPKDIALLREIVPHVDWA